MEYLLKKYYDADGKTINSNAYVLNFLASVIDSVTTFFILLLVTKCCGLIVAGYFSLASALAYQVSNLGKFGIRNYMASDTNKEFSFSEYYYLRLANFGMMLVLIVYLAFSNASDSLKCWVIILYCLIKSTEVIEDLYCGELHRQGRLDIASLFQTIRSGFVLTSIITVVILLKDLVLALTVGTVVSLALVIREVLLTKKYFGITASRRCLKDKLYSLFLKTLPLGLCVQLNLYLTNYPKYQIDRFLRADNQAIFGYLSMPIFVISLVGFSIYNPMIKELAVCRRNHDLKMYRRIVGRVFAIIAALGVLAIVLAYICGTQVLSFVFGIDLNAYRFEFVLLIFGGIFNALARFMDLILTIERKQKHLLLVYVASTLIALCFSKVLLVTYGLLGAVILYSAIFVLLFVMMFLFERIVV